jgi:hypothetical protein
MDEDYFRARINELRTQWLMMKDENEMLRLRAEIARLRASDTVWKIIAKQNNKWNALPQSEKEETWRKALDAEVAASIEKDDEIERLRADRDSWKILAERSNERADRLLTQLPDEMKQCAILFKECEKGHGRLTATNWIDHGCGQCEIERLRAENELLRDVIKRHRSIRR